jgi:hypothetical protein
MHENVERPGDGIVVVGFEGESLTRVSSRWRTSRMAGNVLIKEVAQYMCWSLTSLNGDVQLLVVISDGP